MFEFDIKGLDYHWFWGIVYRTELNGNISSHLHSLATDSTYLKQVTDTVAQIGQKNLMVRALYRLFNIQQYAFYSNILDIHDMNNKQQPRTSWGEVTRLLIPEDEKSDADHFYLKVTSEVLIHLHTLGLEPKNRERIDWHMIRKTYLSLVRIHHPDKGGTPQQFIEIKTAYEALEKFKHEQSFQEDEEEERPHLNPYDYFRTRLEQAEQHLDRASELYPEFSVHLRY